MSETIVIAGAGPVGLTLALLLHKQGRKVRVYEAVSEIRPLGVGINLLPHSIRVLYALGLGEQLDQVGIRTSQLHYYNKFGQQIWAEPRGIDAGYQFPQYSVHRGELQLLLLEAVQQRLGNDAVVTGHKLTGWQGTAEGLKIKFSVAGDIDTERQSISVCALCLVAADGINSNARKILYPDEGAPIYGGRILWRGTAQAQPFLDGKTMFMAGHQDCKFVAYPIASQPDGKSLINWIAELSVPDYQQNIQDWSKEVSIDVFKDSFNDWRFSWLDIPTLIQSAEHVYEFPLSDREPLPQWTHGNMTLIGDAAHPMYPIGSNGASQGILDAEKLTIELGKDQPVQDALTNYELERRPATAKIVLLNRQNGPEQVMQIAEERAPAGFDDINQVITRSELEEIAGRYKQTAGFTVAAVNRS